MAHIYQVAFEKLPKPPTWFCAPNDREAVLALQRATYLGALSRKRGVDPLTLHCSLLDVGMDAQRAGLRSTEIERAFLDGAEPHDAEERERIAKL